MTKKYRLGEKHPQRNLWRVVADRDIPRWGVTTGEVWGRVSVLAVVISVFAVSCSPETSSAPPPETAAPLKVVPSSTRLSEPTTTVPPTLATSTTLSALTTVGAPVVPSDTVVAYLNDLAAAEARVGELVEGMLEVDMSLLSQTTDPPPALMLLDDVLAGVRELEAAVSRMRPPSVGELEQAHGAVVEAVGEISDAADEVLAGVWSPDTGDRYRRGLAAFLTASDHFAEVAHELANTVAVVLLR